MINQFFRGCALIAVILCIGFIHTAIANDPGVISSSTETFTGNQSSGVTASSPPILTIDVNSLNQAIAPGAGTNGINLSNGSAGNVTINSGSAGGTITINTSGAGNGIFIQSTGNPSAPANDPFLGVPIPTSATVSGGVVTVNSFSNISTTGAQASGISAASATSGYPGSVAAALQNFTGTGFSFQVTGVTNADLTNGTVGDPVTAGQVILPSGTDAGAPTPAGPGDAVTLGSNGSYSFDPGAAFAALPNGSTMYISVLDTITGSNSNNHATETVTGTLVFQVTRTGTGSGDYNFTPVGSDFSALGSSSGVLPDPAGYVSSLLPLVGAGGAGNGVTVTNSGSIQTSGSGAQGIYATSQGGNGAGGRNASITHSSTQGGVGSQGGTVTVTANGSISTGSTNAAGVLAWSLGGQGGSGGDSGDTRNAKDGGLGGTGGTVNVYGNGAISTSGSGATGILALSEGGNGGQGGSGSTFDDGSDGGNGGLGGTVVVSGTWNITTTGDQSHGIWAKSTGGLAGGGGAGGWAGSGAGNGGAGSDGGSVTVNSSGTIMTGGSNSYGIYAESVGGFGGSGGDGTSIFYAAGGGGNSAGSGGAVSVANYGTIITTGLSGDGIFAQSVGGGGGSGGGGGGLVALGGGGASGGNGGEVTVYNSGTIMATGSGARGIYAQSLGGGGGDGGDTVGLAPIGGDGSSTSSGSNASVYNTGNITAASNAILAQSVGGGGGNGGSAVGWFSVGGGGGSGGNGEAVQVTSNGNLSTSDDNSSALFAQSLGGGGGNGGNSTAVGAFGSLAIGGNGAAGGTGGTVQVGVNPGSSIMAVTGTISTTGANSNGIQAQSLGGGGGNGGYAFAGSIGSGVSISVGIGGTGGGGGASSEVDVYYGNASSFISTTGANSDGIFAQSVGGGGGSGGFAIAAAGGDGFTAAVALGGVGGKGGNGGVVNVGSLASETSGTISTMGDQSYGIFAQSVGGGGGDGGFSVAGTVSVGGVGGSLSFGGSGTSGGTGNTVNLYSASDVSTMGNNSTALFAQSVGGGGGSGGFSIAAGLATGGALDLSFGGSGGGGGNGGAVTLYSDGSLVTTAGNNSDGLLAQSLGGGGGNGGFSVAGSLTGGPAVNLAIGGGGGTASSGSSVTVENSSTIETGGNSSAGIFAQSVGGGGGSGGFSIAAGISINPVEGGAGSNVSVGLGGDGGAGGTAGNVVVTTTGSMIMTGTGYASGTYGNNSDGILAQSTGGGGGAGGFSIAGGIASGASINFSMAGSGTTGGNAGTVSVTSSSVVVTNGTNSSAIFAQSVGGGGGQGGFSVAGGITDESASINASIGGGGGSGGTAGSVTVISTGPLVMAGSGTAFNSNDNHSYGIVAQSVGGSGGDGGFSVAGGISISGPTLNFSLGGAGGDGQDAGAVQLLSTSEVVTHGNDSAAIFAQSLGGGGGSGGFSVSGGISGDSVAIDASIGGSGAGGGSAGNVAVGATITGTDNATGLPTYSGSAITGPITTYGNNSDGIVAQSIGGGGGNGGFSIAGGISDSASVNFSMGGSGGNAGSTGDVVLDSASSVFTSGSNSTAIFAQSLGGGGGNGGFSVEGSVSANSGAVGASIGGDGSAGGNAATVTVISTGNMLMTTGDQSDGILAQSLGGGGGNGGFSVAGSITAGNSGAAVSFSMGGKGGGGGTSDAVYVDSSSSIQTDGANSTGIFAQSLGGGGGAGGFSVTGNISTGSTASVGASIGGNGGTGNTAGNVTVISSGSMIITGGNNSAGIIAQSIGGSGGEGGFSVAGSISTGTNVNFSLGGHGGSGANAGIVIVSSSSAIGTTGTNSDGIFAQSVGGGGGGGGFSVAGSITTGSNTPSVDVSIGGSGGIAGSGTTVNVTSTGTLISTEGIQSVGILAQSVGGGGGSGAFSVAGGISTGTNVNFSLGGKGGSAGTGGNVTVSSSSSITTISDDSDGILAQSLGGGGGDGGFSVAGGISTGSQTPTVNASIGGGGGTGQDGGTVSVTSTGALISTSGDHSDGILAQSLGGGGGSGGFSVAGGFSKVNAVDFSLGGAGGPGEDASTVTLDSSSNITTTGNYSPGIMAQSVGGGGGDGGFSVAASGVASGTAIDSTTTSITASIGGGGGNGGTGGNVTVGNLTAITGTISTSGTQSTGILAQSIGGGGGNGGFSIAGSIDTKGGSKSIAFSLGGGGGGGATSGTVAVNSAATIMTNDENSIGILAQSVGGGGGNGGFSVAGAVSVGGTDMQTSMSLSAAIGGHGGGGNTGNVVTVTNSGAITTQADDSTGILAQSVGGGGGNGGWSLGVSGITNANSNSKNIAMNLSVGGGGGAGNDANNVTVINTGDIVTNGGNSDGIAAQSIGGGGGNGGTAKTFTMLAAGAGSTVANIPGIGPSIASKLGLQSGSQSNNYELTISVGGTGGGSGNGGIVTVSSTSNISTDGIGSKGISAQSIGGGGGNGGDGLLGTGTPADDVTIADNSSIAKNLSFAVGGNAGSDGNGSVVTVNESGTISTQGLYSDGIFAQSIGGGGGAAYLTITGTEQAGNAGPTGGSATIGMTGKVGIGGAGGAAGNGSDVNVTIASGSISTTGNGSSGIYAQSVGGGGGEAGDVDRGLKSEGINFGIGLAFGRSGGGGGNGGNVTVSSTTSITTMGDNSFGIFAQSVGGGGGEIGSLGIGPEIPIALFIGSVGGSGTSGVVTITQTGNIATSGSDASGIFAQSAAGSGTAGNVNVTLAGNVTTSGSDSDGIYVQSVSQSPGNNGSDLVTITSGTVQGSSGTDTAGVRLVDGNNNQLTNHGTIETADMISGSAIVADMISGTALLDSTKNNAVDNFGVVIGSIDLGSGSNSFTHETTGLFESGAVINLGSGNYFYNSGTISPGAAGTLQTTTLTGNFTQTGSACWFFDITPSFTSDLFVISGTANLASYENTVNLNELAVPDTTGTYTLITAVSGLTGTFHFGTMSGSTMPVGLTYFLSNSDTQEQLDLVTSTGPFYWPGAVDSVWNDDFVSGSENWTSDAAGANYIYGTPGVADDVYFSTTNAINQNTTLGADFLINSLIVSDTNGASIGGTNSLTLAAAGGAGITVNSGAGAFTITADLVLGNDQSWTNNSSNQLDITAPTVTASGSGKNLLVEGPGITLISSVIGTGTGSLTKDGTGMLVLYGTPNTYSGGTLLKNGTLLVSNSNALGTGSANLTGGTFATTNDPATSATTPLHVNVGGSYTQSSPALLQLRILGPTGVNDEMVVTGLATLGGTFRPDYSVTGYNPIPPAGNYTDAFEVLRSTAGVSGTFSAYIDPHFNPNKLLRWEPYYDPNDVMLEWVQHPFSGLTNLTYNQTSVANAIDLELGIPVPPAPRPYNQSTGPALDAHPGLRPLINFLNNDSLADLPGDYDSISPEALTSIFDISRSFADVQDSNIENRLASLRGANTPVSDNTTVGFLVSDDKSSVDLRNEDSKDKEMPVTPDMPRSDLFIEGNGDFVRVNGDGNAAGYNFTTGGVTVGGDYRVNNHFIIGLKAGYANTGATLTQGGAVDVNGGNAGIYSTIFGNGLYLNTAATGGYNSYDTHRSVLGGIAQGNTDGEDFDGLISTGYDLRAGHFTLGPVASAQYTYVSIHGYDEAGSLAPLHIETQNQSSLRTKAGFKLSSDWVVRGVRITPTLTAAWQHEFLDSAFTLDSEFASGAGNVFAVKGPNVGRDGVVVNAGVNLQWTPRFSTYLYYYGELGRKNYQLNSVNVGASISY